MNRYCLIILCFITSTVAFGQNAILISADGDTVRAEIVVKNKFYFELLRKSNDGELVALSPTDWHSVQINDGAYFKSQLQLRDTVIYDFVQVLMESSISLLLTRSTFYFEKEGVAYELENDKVENDKGGYSVIQTSNKYRRIINYLMSDCPGLTKKVQKTNYNSRSLEDIVELYALCHNQPVINYPNSY